MTTMTSPPENSVPGLLALVHDFSPSRSLLLEVAPILDLPLELIPTLKQAFESLLAYQPAGLLFELGHQGCQHLELIAAADAFHLDVPLLFLSTDQESQALPFDWSSRIKIISNDQSPQDMAALLTQNLDQVRTTDPLRASDYLQLTILGRQSVNLELYFGQGVELHLEVVGGDLWNVFGGEDRLDEDTSEESRTEESRSEKNIAIQSLAAHIGQFPNSVKVRSLVCIPSVRNLDESGLELLRRIHQAQLTAQEHSSTGRITQAFDPARLEETIAEIDELPSDGPDSLARVELDRKENRQSQQEARQEKFEKLLTLGLEAALSRDYESALSRFEEAAEIDSNDPRVIHNLQQIRRRLQR